MTTTAAYDAWWVLVRYYGALCARPGWEAHRSLFDLVKQIATSQQACEFFPELVADDLVIARAPGRAGPRITITFTADRQFHLRQYLADNPAPRELVCNREQVFNVLVVALRAL